MKRLGIIAVLAMFALPALGQIDAKVEKELQASYKKVVAAIKKKDVKAIMNHMTPDATMTEMGHKMTRAEFEPMLKQRIPMLDLQSSTIKFTKVTAKGDLATTEYTETMTAKMKTPDGKSGLLESASKSKTTFKKIGGDWKMKDSVTIGTPTMKLDGKAMNMPTGAPR